VSILASYPLSRPLPRTRAGDVLAVLAGAAAMAVAARIKLPTVPVEITAQTLAVLLIGALLGPQRGALSLLVYLAAGAAGAPIFTAGGGPWYLLGPKGGYLVGFVPAAYVAGVLTRRAWCQSAAGRVLALVIADADLFAFGLAWLAILPLGGKGLLMAGLVPFIPGEVLKITIAAAVIRRMGPSARG